MSRNTDSRKSSTPIKAVSSPQLPWPTQCSIAASSCPWTVGKPGATTCFKRTWRSVKYEEVYLKAYDSISHARRSIGDYFNLYNQRRPHSSLEDRTPDEAYFATLPAIKSAT
ncbi:hypothetical protein D1006_34705 [Burkholderia stabilis]|uniref:Integrase catalytic domain-containing protein n=1 Tax=Burkholderia stabilis TaxID=95485 RepID=A0A4Q2A792_9BURK|nr:hypothetical protein D1006_34705 [Burkholderia stabilis]